jgi:hypothetical protein
MVRLPQQRLQRPDVSPSLSYIAMVIRKEIEVNSILKGSIVVVLLCSACAFATGSVAAQLAGQARAALSLNPQPLPPHDPPHPDTVSPRPRPKRTPGIAVG